MSDLPGGRLTTAHRRVAREVLVQGPVSRSELARRLDLSRASLTRLTKPLLAEGLVIECETQHERRTGRPVRPLDVAADCRHFVGVNLSGDHLTAVLTTLRAEKVASTDRSLPAADAAAVVDAISRAVDHLCADDATVTGLGVSLGGHVRQHRVVSRAPFLGWDADVPLAALLEAETALPVAIDNDVQALTRAEHWFGAGLGRDHFAVVTIGAGVGCGLLIHDRIVESGDTGLGLLGHHPLDPSGPLCRAGHRGCASAMLTTPMICDRVSAAHGRRIGYDEFLDLVDAGDAAACTVARESGAALGRLIATVANATMTQRVVLTGEGVGLVALVSEHVDRAIARDRHAAAARLEVIVQPCDRSEWARGAAVAAIQTYVLG